MVRRKIQSKLTLQTLHYNAGTVSLVPRESSILQHPKLILSLNLTLLMQAPVNANSGHRSTSSLTWCTHYFIHCVLQYALLIYCINFSCGIRNSLTRICVPSFARRKLWNNNNNNNNNTIMRNLTQQKFKLRFEYSIKMSM